MLRIPLLSNHQLFLCDMNQAAREVSCDHYYTSNTFSPAPLVLALALVSFSYKGGHDIPSYMHGLFFVVCFLNVSFPSLSCLLLFFYSCLFKITKCHPLLHMHIDAHTKFFGAFK